MRARKKRGGVGGGGARRRPHSLGRGRWQTVGRQQEQRPRAPFTPSDLVDPLLNLEALQVVEFRLVALELAIEAILHVLLTGGRAPGRSRSAATQGGLVSRARAVGGAEREGRGRGAGARHCFPVRLWQRAARHTADGPDATSDDSNMTTRPPRSPVARYSPVPSNSTALIRSSARRADAPPAQPACRRGGFQRQGRPLLPGTPPRRPPLPPLAALRHPKLQSAVTGSACASEMALAGTYRPQGLRKSPSPRRPAETSS